MLNTNNYHNQFDRTASLFYCKLTFLRHPLWQHRNSDLKPIRLWPGVKKKKTRLKWESIINLYIIQYITEERSQTFSKHLRWINQSQCTVTVPWFTNTASFCVSQPLHVANCWLFLINSLSSLWDQLASHVTVAVAESVACQDCPCSQMAIGYTVTYCNSVKSPQSVLYVLMHGSTSDVPTHLIMLAASSI